MNPYLSRINQLSRKEKKVGLNQAELHEQSILRKMYLQKFREQASGIIKIVRVIDEDGNDLTPSPQQLED